MRSAILITVVSILAAALSSTANPIEKVAREADIVARQGGQAANW